VKTQGHGVHHVWPPPWHDRHDNNGQQLQEFGSRRRTVAMPGRGMHDRRPQIRRAVPAGLAKDGVGLGAGWRPDAGLRRGEVTRGCL